MILKLVCQLFNLGLEITVIVLARLFRMSDKKKGNPVYRTHWISQCVWIIATIQKNSQTDKKDRNGHTNLTILAQKISYVTCHMLCVKCHMSHVACHLSSVTCHLSLTPTATATQKWNLTMKGQNI